MEICSPGSVIGSQDVSLVPDPAAWATVHSMNRNHRVRLNSSANSRQSSAESVFGPCKHHSHHSTSASSAIVLDHQGLTYVPPHKLSLGPLGANATQVWVAAQESGHAGSSCMTVVWRSLCSLGTSTQVLSLVAGAHRKGTQSVYSFYGSQGTDWCATHLVDPACPSYIYLANFFLSSEHRLSASSVLAHRAIICTIILQSSGSPFQTTVSLGMW